MNQKFMTIDRFYRFAVVVGSVVLIAAFSMLIVGTMNSADVNARSDDENGCTLKTLQGLYSFEGRGVIRDGDKVLPYAEAGNQTFDGEGNIAGVFSASVDGEPIATRDFFTATYSIDPDCTGVNVAPVGDGFIEFHIYTDPAGTVFSYFGEGFSGRGMKGPEKHSNTKDMEAQVKKASAAWDEAFNEADLGQLMQLYAEGAVSMPPNLPLLEGKPALEADFQGLFDNFTAHHETTIVDLEIDGNLAVEQGKYKMNFVPKDDSKPFDEVGKHIVVRRKIGDKWLVVREIWNTDE